MHETTGNDFLILHNILNFSKTCLDLSFIGPSDFTNAILIGEKGKINHINA